VPVSDYEVEVVGWDAQQQENYDYEYDEPGAEDFVDWLRDEALRELRRKAQLGEEITEDFLFEVVGLGEALPDDEMVPIYKGEFDWAADFGEVIDEFGVMGTAELILRAESEVEALFPGMLSPITVDEYRHRFQV